MIRQCELRNLFGLHAYFPLIGEMMIGAVSEVCTDGTGDVPGRLHMIAVTDRFPVVGFAVEGVPGLSGPLPFFGLSGRYRHAEWVLVDSGDELRLRLLIERWHGQSDAVGACVAAEVERRRVARALRVSAAVAAGTALCRAQARARLLSVARRPRCAVPWHSVLKDMGVVLGEIGHPGDRAFLSAILARSPQPPTLSREQVRWLSQILARFAGAACR